MTRDEVLALRPGREMDWHVAAVLGHDDEDDDSDPHYSTDHAAAMEALEEYCRPDPRRYFRILSPEVTIPNWDVDLYAAGDPERNGNGQSDIPAMAGLAFAACRAILLCEAKG